MIVAEENSQCYFQAPIERIGPLALGNEGYHAQFQIINYSRQPIYVIDSDNKAYLCKTGQHRHGDAHVRIYHRCFTGVNKVDDNLFDGNKATIREAEIPLSLLQEGPVYCAMINMVICIGRDNNLESIHHPQSREYRHQNEDSQIFSAQDVSNASPFILAANDPTGRIKELFVEVNGVICHCAVTSFPGIRDTVVISFRMGTRDHPIQKSVRTSFSELMRTGPHLWEINNVRFSTNYNVLKEAIALQKNSENGQFISKKDYSTHIELLERNHSLRQHQADETIGVLNDQIKALKDQIDLMMKQGYSDEAKNLEIEKLNFQKEKLEQERETMRIELERLKAKLRADEAADREKTKRSQMDTLMSYGKVIIAVASVAALVAKYIEPSKS